MRQFYVKRKRPRVVVDYFSYIKGSLWQERKERYYRKYKKLCKACGTRKDIDLHHTIYGNWGNEPDYSLIPLCRNCHKELHRTFPSPNRLLKETLEFIKRKQQQIKITLQHTNTIDSK